MFLSVNIDSCLLNMSQISSTQFCKNVQPEKKRRNRNINLHGFLASQQYGGTNQTSHPCKAFQTTVIEFLSVLWSHLAFRGTKSKIKPSLSTVLLIWKADSESAAPNPDLRSLREPGIHCTAPLDSSICGGECDKYHLDTLHYIDIHKFSLMKGKYCINTQIYVFVYEFLKSKHRLIDS